VLSNYLVIIMIRTHYYNARCNYLYVTNIFPIFQWTIHSPNLTPSPVDPQLIAIVWLHPQVSSIIAHSCSKSIHTRDICGRWLKSLGLTEFRRSLLRRLHRVTPSLSRCIRSCTWPWLVTTLWSLGMIPHLSSQREHCFQSPSTPWSTDISTCLYL